MGRLPLVALLILALAGCLQPDASPEEARRPTAAERLARAEPHPHLVVDVMYVAERAPSPVALEALLETLQEETDKASVTLLEPREISGYTPREGHRWSNEELDAFLDEHAQPETELGNDTVRLVVVYLEGGGPGAELGLAGGLDIFVFPDFTRETVPGGPRASTEQGGKLERRILIHELGHALGLVGCGAPMLTPRSSGGCHSVNEASVMHADLPADLASALRDAVEEGSGIPYRFDADDRADLAALRAG